MIDLNVTFLVQLVNFLLTLAVLNLVLFRPIRGMLRKRSEIMEEKLSSIESFTNEAQEQLAQYQEALRSGRDEAQKIRVNSREVGQQAEAEILSATSHEVAEKMAAVRKDIDTQKTAAMKALKSQVAGYSKKVAHKMLAKA